MLPQCHSVKHPKVFKEGTITSAGTPPAWYNAIYQEKKKKIWA